MGVHATYCLLCGMPVQHDHYVATEHENRYLIYRETHRPPGHFPFTPEHDWMRRGVALRKGTEPIFGAAEDGVITATDGTNGFVGDGYEEYGALHTYCWEALGCPKSCESALHQRGAFEATFSARYQAQLFDFELCASEGNGWMLVDPTSANGERNRGRISALAAATPPPDTVPGDALALLASDCWTYCPRAYDGGTDFWRYRNNVTAEISRSAFPSMVWLIFDPGETPRSVLDEFERALYKALQGRKDGVALITLTVRGKCYMVMAARDGDACDQLAARVCPLSEYQIERDEGDSAWAAYFEQIFPRLA